MPLISSSAFFDTSLNYLSRRVTQAFCPSSAVIKGAQKAALRMRNSVPVMSTALAVASYGYFYNAFPTWQKPEQDLSKHELNNNCYPLTQTVFHRLIPLIFCASVVSIAQGLIQASKQRDASQVNTFLAVLGGIASASFQKEDFTAALSKACLVNYYGILTYSQLNDQSLFSSEAVSNSNSSLFCLMAFCTTQMVYRSADLSWLALCMMPVSPLLCDKVSDYLGDTSTKKILWNDMLSLCVILCLDQDPGLDLQNCYALFMFSLFTIDK